VIENVVREARRDFKEFADECMGILLYGSYARGDCSSRSDIDICVVKPAAETFKRMLEKLGGKYDLKVFEELPLFVRVDIVKNHVRIYAKDEIDLYFYRVLKVWKDMEHRIKENAFKNVEEKIRNRGRWLNAKKEILGKA